MRATAVLVDERANFSPAPQTLGDMPHDVLHAFHRTVLLRFKKTNNISLSKVGLKTVLASFVYDMNLISKLKTHHYSS